MAHETEPTVGIVVVSHSGDVADAIVSLVAQLANLDLKRGELRVYGKGRKERIGLLGRPARSAIRAYLEDGRPLLLSRRTLGAVAFRWLIAMRIPSIANEVMRDHPPWLTNGRVIPVMGSMRMTPPILTRDWNPIKAVKPAAISFVNMSGALRATAMPESTSATSAAKTRSPPATPISSAIAA